MTERIEGVLDEYLDLKLQDAKVQIESVLAAHPELEEAGRERLRRLAELLGERVDANPQELHASMSRDRVGPYNILRELGRGGQGAVFLAEDTRFARKVALKVSISTGLDLRSDPQERESAARLKREAEVISRLDHAGICVVYEMGVERDVRYIAMRYVEGETLARRIADARASSEPLGKWPASEGRSVALSELDGAVAKPRTPPSTARRSVDRVLALVEQTARALHAAHEAGVVHRDVKPGNIMVTPEGQPVLLDFGLARDLEHATATLTVSGKMLGTPAYMAPEQLSSGRPVGASADVYSLGVTLYECLTLQRPFEAPTRELLYRGILTDKPPAPRRFNASISRDLEVVLETAMDKDTGLRYQTALDFAEDLRRVREREPIRARPAGLLVRCARWSQRNPVLAAAFAGVLLSLASGLAVSLHLLQRERAALDREHAARTDAEGQGLLAESRAALPTNPGLALLLAIECAQRTPGPSVNGVLLDAIGELRERRTLVTHPQMNLCGLSPDGRFLVTISRDGTERVSDADRGTPVAVLAGHGGEGSGPLFSPGGMILATNESDGACRLWSTATWSTLRALREPDSFMKIGRFDLADQRVLTWSADASRGVARIWDVERELPRVLESGGPDITQSAFSPDGRRVLLVSGSRGARVWRVDVEPPRPLLEVPNPVLDQDIAAIFSPDGGRILVAFGRAGAGLWEVDTRKQLLSLEAEWRGVGPLAFRADGRRILVAHGDGRAGIWDVPSRGVVCELSDIRTGALASFSPDGARILARASDGSAALWNAVTGEQLAKFQGHGETTADARFSRSGLTVITSSSDGTVREWNLESERQRTTLRASHGKILRAGLDPSGMRIAAATDLGHLELIDVDSHVTLLDFQGSGLRTARSLAFSADGNRLLTTGSVRDFPTALLEDAARSWNAETGASIAVFRHPDHTCVYDARFSPDGRRVVTAADDCKARIFEADTGHLLRELVGHLGGVRSASFSPAGARVVTTSETQEDTSVRIWDAESGAELLVLSGGGERPVAACFSPDGRRVAAACWWGRACLWDASSGELVRKWQAHPSHLVSIEFSPDGSRILTACADLGARLWDSETGEEVLSLGKQMSVTCASFSSDGRRILAASSDDGAAHIWPVDPLRRARELAPRDLTAAERERYGLPPKD